jgi:hypothetical protein
VSFKSKYLAVLTLLECVSMSRSSRRQIKDRHGSSVDQIDMHYQPLIESFVSVGNRVSIYLVHLYISQWPRSGSVTSYTAHDPYLQHALPNPFALASASMAALPCPWLPAVEAELA